MRVFLFFIVSLLSLLACNQSDLKKYPSGATLFSSDSYVIEEVFRGPNAGATVAVILSTNEIKNESELSAIKKEVVANKTVCSCNTQPATFIVKNKNKVYGVLFDDYTQTYRKDVLVPIDTIRHHVHKMRDKRLQYLNGEHYEGPPIEVIGNFALLKGLNWYKNEFRQLLKEKEAGAYSWHGINIDIINNRMMLRTGVPENPTYTDEIRLLESGDIGFYSQHYGGYLNYYLRVD